MKPEAWEPGPPPAPADRKAGRFHLDARGPEWFGASIRQGRFEDWKSWQRPSTDNTFLDGIGQENRAIRLGHGDAARQPGVVR